VHRLAGSVVDGLLHAQGSVDRPIAVLERRPGTDDVLAWHAVHLVRDEAHEVTSAAGADEDPEVVGPEQVQQLPHRHIAHLGIGTTKGRVLRVSEEAPNPGFEFLGRDPPEPLGESLQELGDVIEERTEPFPVALDERLVWLLARLRWIGLDHLLPAPEDEVGLDVEWLLAPQRPVVVERCDPICWCDESIPARGHRPDELEDARLGGALVPAGKRVSHVSLRFLGWLWCRC
jgi:hypothetical protein